MKQERVIFSGAGGQGLMFIGKLFAGQAVNKFPHVTFIPSYGAEVRGGTSNCLITLSDEEIASPMVEEADSVVVMNQPSAERFLPMLATGGTAFVNLSMVDMPKGMSRVVAVPATQWAQELGDIRTANMVMLGAYLGEKRFFTMEEMVQAVERIPAGRGGAQATAINVGAFVCGWEHGTNVGLNVREIARGLRVGKSRA